MKTSTVIQYVNTAKISSDDKYFTYMRQLEEMTMTAKIFELSAPYDNPYQSDRPRWLFVCSVGLLRSQTAAAVATELGANAHSCGSNVKYALIPMSVNLIMWADKIFFIGKDNYVTAKLTFEDLGYQEYIEQKAIVLDIPDIYETFDPTLCEIFRNELPKYL